MNIQNLMQLLRGGQNPQQLAMNLLEQGAQNNPLNANLLNLAKSNQTDAIEQIARNMFKEKGLDFDKEFTAFKQMLGL